MKIAVISDLHLGPLDITDQFGHDDFEFIKFLIFLESNFEKIVLLGDIYECLMPKRFGSTKELLALCKNAHKEIVKRFENPQYHYIHGNHDIVSSSYNIPEELYLKTDNQAILFTHGHQYDSLIKSAKFISEFGAWLGGWTLRLGFSPVYKFVNKIEEILGCGGGNKVKDKFQQLATNTAKQRNADIIVTGHTHIGNVSEYNNKLYMNSGTCSEGKYSFLSIDTKTGEYNINNSW